MLRLVRNIVGHAQGYGTCRCCDNHWNVVEPKNISFDVAGGYLLMMTQRALIPVCTTCFDTLTPDEILRYIHLEINDWMKENFVPWPNTTPWNRIERRAYQSMLFLKGATTSVPWGTPFSWQIEDWQLKRCA